MRSWPSFWPAAPSRALGRRWSAFPQAMVKEYLSLVPERFSLGDRKGGRREVSPDGDSTFWTAAALFYLDRKGFRPIERKDLADFAWVIENLAEVDAIVGTATEDTPPPHRDFVGFRIMAENTENTSARSPLRPGAGRP